VKVLYFDCFSGASGDMVLGALIDAGVPLAAVQAALGSLAVAPAGRDSDLVWTTRVTRAGLSATKFCVAGSDSPPGHVATPAAAHAHSHEHTHTHDHEHGHSGEQVHSHGHPHEHEHSHSEGDSHAHDQGPADAHSHRTLHEIHHLIDRSALSGPGKARAKALFVRLGEAEAAVHGISIDTVHLHEVGALDSIIDIVGSVFALEWLGVDRIIASPLNVGSGSIRSAHGLYPVPAPATAQLLQGAPVYAGPQPAELLTPTGALLVTSYADAYGPLPAMRINRIGYGAGTRDFADSPNVLRVLIGDSQGDAGASVGSTVGATATLGVGTSTSREIMPAPGVVVVLEAEIDDMNPQIFGVLMDRLLAEGALDVFYTAVQMKKNRPGTLLSVVAPPALREGLSATIFRETTTIGLRYREMHRTCLDRETVTVATPFGDVRLKVSRLGGEVLTATPEFDDCLRMSAAHGRPFKDVQAAAAQAFAAAQSPKP
jgi:pyridinium-3,5-bisthiocarboxylic acid mononucleotide nickel chelatase